MNKVDVVLVKAFTDDPSLGNPAGVILDADGLSIEQMTSISSQLGFSESAFVQKSNSADFKVRFFSPTQEVDLCGHATIATFHVLIEKEIIVFGNSKKVTRTMETKAGVLPVTCHEDRRIDMMQNAPEFSDPETDKKRIAELLGISFDNLLDYPIQTISTGTPKLIVPVDSLETLFMIKPDFDGIIAYCKEKKTKGFYPFTFETKEKESDFHARQFNPLAGINEDPITGVAAGELGAYVVKYKLSKKRKYIIEQGYIMSKGGKIFVDVTGDIKVGGYAVRYDTKSLKL